MAHEIRTAASVTKLGDDDRDSVLLAGSHGGVYAGYCAAVAGVRAVILNDAGIGKDSAGIASLPYLDDIGLAAATVSHITARIGDGPDMLENGVISAVNQSALGIGCREGDSAEDCAEKMLDALPANTEPPTYQEARFLFEDMPQQPRTWGLDSAGLVRPDDAGHIVITGSHGGLLGGDPALAIKADVLACAFNDAGIGKDQAGTSRLPALDARGIPAVTLDCMSARIGDSRSAWKSGQISAVNQMAQEAGVEIGMNCQAFIDQVLQLGRLRH